MSENKDTVLYLSNTTDFVPTVDNFVFDSDTTEKAVTYFYLDAEREIDSDYTLKKENDFLTKISTSHFFADSKVVATSLLEPPNLPVTSTLIWLSLMRFCVYSKFAGPCANHRTRLCKTVVWRQIV